MTLPVPSCAFPSGTFWGPRLIQNHQDTRELWDNNSVSDTVRMKLILQEFPLMEVGPLIQTRAHFKRHIHAHNKIQGEQFAWKRQETAGLIDS